MGYYYKADFVLRLTESATVAMSLDVERLRANVNANPYSWDLPDNAFADGDIVGSLLNVLDFEVDETWDENTLIQGVTSLVNVKTITGHVSTKLNTNLDVIVAWMASHGVGIDMDCQGEDDALWRYYSDINSGVLLNQSLSTIPHDDLAQLKAAKATVDELLALSSGSDSPAVDALLKVLASYQKASGQTPVAFDSTELRR